MAFIEPCFGIGHSLSLICQMTSEDIKHQLIIIIAVWGGAEQEHSSTKLRMTQPPGLIELAVTEAPYATVSNY